LTMCEDQVINLAASSGCTSGPPRFQPLWMFKASSSPSRDASSTACLNRLRHSAEPNNGPAGTAPLPCCSAPPASKINAPRKPLALISSRSLEIEAFVTLPLSHHQKHDGPYFVSGLRNCASASGSCCPSATRAQSSSMPTENAMPLICFPILDFAAVVHPCSYRSPYWEWATGYSQTSA